MERNELICRMTADLMAGYMSSPYRGVVANTKNEEYDIIFNNCVETAEQIVDEVYSRNPEASTGGR